MLVLQRTLVNAQDRGTLVQVSALILGQRMVRTSDGMRGQVVLEHGVPRIRYSLMADDVLAPAKEAWVPEEQPRLPLRDEEIDRVAGVADQVLYCMMTHTPWRFWENHGVSEPKDRGLVEVIRRYLKEKR